MKHTILSRVPYFSATSTVDIWCSDLFCKHKKDQWWCYFDNESQLMKKRLTKERDSWCKMLSNVFFEACEVFLIFLSTVFRLFFLDRSSLCFVEVFMSSTWSLFFSETLLDSLLFSSIQTNSLLTVMYRKMAVFFRDLDTTKVWTQKNDMTPLMKTSRLTNCANENEDWNFIFGQNSI